MQVSKFDDVDVIFNENELGHAFFPMKVDYVVTLRNPEDVVLSVLQNRFCTMENGQSWDSDGTTTEGLNAYIQRRGESYMFRNYVLKFFYTHCEHDTKILLEIARSRIKKFRLVMPLGKMPRLTAGYISRRYGKEVDVEHRHVRQQRAARLKDLSPSNQQLVTDLVHEDVEFVREVVKL